MVVLYQSFIISILCVLTLPNFRNCYTLVVTVAIVLIKVNMIRLNKICLRAYWGNYIRGPYQYKDATLLVYDDVIKWKHFPRYWPFVRGIHRSPVNSRHKGQWRHNERDGVSNHWRLDCLLNHFFRRRLKKTPKLRVTGLCEGNSQVTGEFPAQRASNAENVSLWWRHHGLEALLHVANPCPQGRGFPLTAVVRAAWAYLRISQPKGIV